MEMETMDYDDKKKFLSMLGCSAQLPLFKNANFLAGC
jgi:hypothetical protein